MNKAGNLLSRLALALVIAELVLVLVSWILSAAAVGSVRSLLSSEGIRWLFGHFASMLATPYLIWLLLIGMGWESVRRSGLSAPRSHRERIAFGAALTVLLLCVVVLVLLTAVPHAILLSATGNLFPSPFSDSLVPFCAVSVMLISIVYGVVAGRFDSLHSVYETLVAGIRTAAPFVLFYMLLVQLYETVCFVFLQQPYF